MADDAAGLRKVYARAHGRKGAALALLGEVEEAVQHLRASLAADPSQNLVRERLLQLTSPADPAPEALTSANHAPSEPALQHQPAELDREGLSGGGGEQERCEDASEGCSKGGERMERGGTGSEALGSEQVRSAEAEVERQKGGRAYKRRSLESALKHYSNACRLEPQNAVHWSNRAAAHFESKDLRACVADCDEALLRARARERGREGGSHAAGAVSGKLAQLRAKVEARKATALQKLAAEEARGSENGQGESENRSASGDARGGGGGSAEGAGDCRYQSKEGGQEEPGELVEKKRQAAEVEKRRGNEMFRGRRYGDAIEYYNKALELDPAQAPLFLLNRAVAYGERGSYMLAAADFDQALARAREELATAKTAARVVEAGEAEAAASTAVSEAADRVCKVLTRKGRMLEKKALKGPRTERARGLREALKCLQEAQKQQPEDTSEQQRGVLGQSIEAVQARLTALRLDDEAKEELANGDRMFADGQHAAAIKFYDKAERADPRGERADAYLMYSNRAGCLLELKRLRQALRDAERCIELKPSWPTGHMLKGRVHEALEDWGQMLSACGKAYDLDPDNETNLAMLRDCLVQHLTDDSLRRQPGAFSDVIGRAREDEALKRLVQDPQVVQVTSEMRRTRDLSPLVKVLEDLPLAGKLAKLFEVGMLVPGM